MVKFKRGQGMPVNVIIIAAISLIVLFVLIIMFTGQSSKTVSTLESCQGIAGQCKKNSPGCLEGEGEKINVKCPSGEKCCIRVYEVKK